MNTLTSAGMTGEYLQRVQRYKVIATICVVCVSLVLFFWICWRSLLGITAQHLVFIYPLVTAVSALAMFAMYQWSKQRQEIYVFRKQSAWLLIGLALCLRGIGEGYKGYLLYFADNSVSVLLLHFLALCAYPLLGIAIVFLYGHKLRTSMIFDVLISTMAIIGIIWYVFVISSAIIEQPSAIAAPLFPGFVATMCHLFGGFFLFLLVLLVIERSVEAMFWPSLLFFCAAILLRLGINLIEAFSTFFWSSEIFLSFYPFISFASIIAVLLMALGSFYYYEAVLQHYLERDQVGKEVRSSVGNLFERMNTTGRSWWFVRNMYVPLTLIICVLLFFQITNLNKPHNEFFSSLFFIITILGGLIVVRHFIVTRENEQLLYERDQRFQEAEQARFFVTQLTHILDLERLRVAIIDVLISKLGFSSGMLILFEKPDVKPTSKSYLLVNTASLSTNATKWKMVGNTLLYRIASSGKPYEVHWANHTPDLPAEVRTWQTKQHIPSMYFFPIIYQEKILGSLGVARRTFSRVDASATTSVRIYAEQIAAIIKHAYLYQEAHEREAFALAMANISKLLNAAVLEPAEISQLICAEGSDALQADYTVFYICHEDGTLEPLAASIGERGRAAPSDLRILPRFRLNNYNAGQTDYRHPFLLDVAQIQNNMQRVSVSFDGIAENSPFRTQHLSHVLTQLAVKTAIIAPLVTGGKLSGMLIFARSHAGGKNPSESYDNTHLQHAQDFVEQASVAFTNAQLYQHLRTAHERLTELDQMKDQFMVTASHELRTPLTAVQGYIELLVQYDEVLPQEQRREFLAKAQLGCEELAILLRNVMDASRLEAESSMKPALISCVSVREMIDKVKVMIEPQLTHEQRQVVISADVHLYVYADPIRLHQVLLNIATNALKYSPPGTPISLRATVNEEERGVVISVVDNGKGIAPKDQPHLFQRFYRLESDMNSPVRGSGLGLYISRRLIEAMGGKIWIESSGIPGEGSAFHILLPMA